jgi:glycosyltransferase involved in cell wall biosynthesis
MRPLLSVVVITRNQAWNIARLLDSIFAELVKMPDSEIILADSASTDETVSIASRYSGVKIVHLRSDQRLTPAAGRYVGFHHSAGELILHLDGDTELIPGWLSLGMELLQARSEVAGVNGIYIDVPKSVPTGAVAVSLVQGDGVRELRFLPGCACLYRRSVLEQVGTFNPWLYGEEEAELALRIRAAGFHLVQIPRRAIFHHSDDVGMTFSRLASVWRRKFIFAAGQVLRNHYGSRLFWAFAKERGYAFLPALVLLVGLNAFGVSAVTGNWRWFCCFLIVVISGLTAYAIRKRSLYATAVWLWARTLIFVGTIRGFLIETPAPSSYRIDSEGHVDDSTSELRAVPDDRLEL